MFGDACQVHVYSSVQVYICNCPITLKNGIIALDATNVYNACQAFSSLMLGMLSKGAR